MGDVISSHLDDGKRQMIAGRTRDVMEDFNLLYEQQYAVALFNQVRFEIEGNGGPQSQLLHRKDPLRDKNIFSGNLFQCLENKKWRNRYFFIPDSYNIYYYENKMAHDRGLHPKGIIRCAGYRVLTSVEEYLELISNSLPGVKAKASTSPFLKCATQHCIILWHPYARHHYFCVMTEREQAKWQAVFQDCIRHTNNELSEEDKVQTPAFTDAVRLYRQARGQYGTWDMMCGEPPQILANLVMESLHPELRDQIGPRLKGKLQQRQRSWMLISDTVYALVLGQTRAQYEATVQICESRRPPLEAALRTDMDQIISSREHVARKIRSVVQPKVEQVLKVTVRPYISSILEALMTPISNGFSEVRDVFSLELVERNKNILNDGNKDRLGEHMEKISMLAFHPVKMQSCYEAVEKMQLEGLQERFNVSSSSVFIQRAQILMREQMDNAVYTFEQLLHQNLESAGEEHMCKAIQRCQDRVVKKFNYDSSTVRKKFLREALLQILIPYLLKQLCPSCAGDLPRFQELIFEDFSRFILVENVFEEVVLQSVMKDINMAVMEAAVMRRHNLYRDSIALEGSDLNLHQLADKPAVDWMGQYGGEEAGGGTGKRRRQVVSMIQLDEHPGLLHESCLDIPGVERIPEEGEEPSPSPSVDTPTPPPSVIETPNADTPTPPPSVIETPNADTPTPPPSVIGTPNADTPTPPPSVIETPNADTPTPPPSVIGTPNADTPTPPPSVIETPNSDTPTTPPSVIETPNSDTPTTPPSVIDTPNSDTPTTPPSVIDTPNSDTPTTPPCVIETLNADTPTPPLSASQILDLIKPKMEVPASEVDSTPLTNGMPSAPASPSEAGSTWNPDDSSFQPLIKEAVDEEEAQPVTEALKDSGYSVADPEKVVVTLEQGDAETGEKNSEKWTKLEPDIVFTI